MTDQLTTRRTVLRSIGAGTALLAGGAAVGSARSESAWIRVAHLSPDAPEVDVELDGPASTEVTVEFTDVTEYLSVPAGEYTVSVPAAGASATVGLEADEYYTGAAIGSLTGQGESFRLALYEDNSGATPKNSRGRLVHASPDAPTVDVTVEDGPVLYRNVSFGESGGYLPVSPGDYTLEVRVAGPGRPGSGPIADTFDVTVPEDVNATVYAVDFLADLDLQVELDG
jgi:hypothetical protein